jgi:hypothetical protein
MKRHAQLLIAALVVLSALPAAAAYATPPDDTRAVSDSGVTAQMTATASGSDTATDSGTAAEAGAETKTTTDYTRLYVDSEDSYLELKPGETAEFSVWVKNAEETDVEVDPHLYVSPLIEYPLKDEWVAIEGPTTIESDEEVEYTVTVTVPKTAETSHYRGLIAFTDEKITYPGRPPRPIHAQHVSIEVWREPTVKILSDTYVRTQVEAGDSVTRQIVIKNEGDEAVPLSPELKTERRHCYRYCGNQLDPSWIDIDAPSQIASGETETVTVTISPSQKADVGRYNAEIDLGLKDPARDERNAYWQRIDVNFVVWKQPSEPFEATFQVSEEAENVTLTLSPRSHYYGSEGADDAEPPSFDVQFVGPDGEVVTHERVLVSDRGHVDLARPHEPTFEEKDYYVRDGGKRFVYRVDDPEAGEWTVRIMPENTIQFSYEIVRNESAE